MNCEGVQFINNVMSIDSPPHDNDSIRDSQVNLIRENIKVIDKSNNWNILLFKESIAINNCSPLLNHGLKASKDLQLF